MLWLLIPQCLKFRYHTRAWIGATFKVRFRHAGRAFKPSLSLQPKNLADCQIPFLELCISERDGFFVFGRVLISSIGKPVAFESAILIQTKDYTGKCQKINSLSNPSWPIQKNFVIRWCCEELATVACPTLLQKKLNQVLSSKLITIQIFSHASISSSLSIDGHWLAFGKSIRLIWIDRYNTDSCLHLGILTIQPQIRPPDGCCTDVQAQYLFHTNSVFHELTKISLNKDIKLLTESVNLVGLFQQPSCRNNSYSYIRLGIWANHNKDYSVVKTLKAALGSPFLFFTYLVP